MSATTSPSPYILLFRGHDWDRGLTAEQTQEVLDRLDAWIDGLVRRGQVKGGSPLDRSGTIISDDQSSVVKDGPFAESKEAIGGYLMIEAENFEAAVAFARKCPTLKLGIQIEVRPVLAECPIVSRLRQQPALATA